MILQKLNYISKILFDFTIKKLVFGDFMMLSIVCYLILWFLFFISLVSLSFVLLVLKDNSMLHYIDLWIKDRRTNAK